MARYTGPKDKISRRFGVPIFGSNKTLEQKNYPPGMHGPKGSRRKHSEYSLALAEKQKLRYQYGILEMPGLYVRRTCRMLFSTLRSEEALNQPVFRRGQRSAPLHLF